MADYDGPERRGNGPTWQDMTNALNGLRSEVRADMLEVRRVAVENAGDIRDEMGELHSRVEDGFDRLDRRIAWAAGIIGTLLLAAISVGVAVIGGR